MDTFVYVVLGLLATAVLVGLVASAISHMAYSEYVSECFEDEEPEPMTFRQWCAARKAYREMINSKGRDL